MNKKVIIGIILAVLVAVVAFGLNSLNKKTFKINGYTISTKAKEETKKIDKSYFVTSFEVEDENNNKLTYLVSYEKLIVSDDGKIYDVAQPDGEIKINNKKFNYYLNSESEATLCYYLPNDNATLEIRIIGDKVVDKNGNEVKKNASVTKKIIESNELKKVLKFNIHK